MDEIEDLWRKYIDGDRSVAYPLFDALLKAGCRSFSSIQDLHKYREFVQGDHDWENWELFVFDARFGGYGDGIERGCGDGYGHDMFQTNGSGETQFVDNPDGSGFDWNHYPLGGICGFYFLTPGAKYYTSFSEEYRDALRAAKVFIGDCNE